MGGYWTWWKGWGIRVCSPGGLSFQGCLQGVQGLQDGESDTDKEVDDESEEYDIHGT